MQKLKMHSPDMTQEHIARIRELFPNCVTEARGKDGSLRLSVDFDLLRQELSGSIVEGPQERYHLDWPGKREAMLAANAPIAKALRPCREESVDFDTTKNLFIEGDNLDALKLLQETYLGKVKMIYIDPPYNTGNDFIYNDDFAETSEAYLSRSNQKDEAGNRLVANPDSNGRFHSDWLSMMYPRLKIARNLLADDGIICINIDDRELSNISYICSEIFGKNNCIGCISRATGTTTGQDANKIGSSVDYILLFSKLNNFSLNGINLNPSDMLRFNFEDARGRYSILQLRKTGNADRRGDRPSMFYPIYSPDGEEILPIGPSGYESRWRFGKEKYDDYCKQDMIIWKKNKNGVATPYVKYYLEGRKNRYQIYGMILMGTKKGL